MTFQENLIRLRKQHSLSQEKLGELLGVSRQTVSKWEIGTSTPEVEKLISLCDVFDISMDEMVGRIRLPSPPIQTPAKQQPETDVPQAQPHTIVSAPPCYEFKSRIHIRGVPLVHINIGWGFRKAKGILAIGNISEGIIAIGGISIGLISIGGLSVGLFAFGCVALSLLFAFGGFAVAPFAFGGFALGYLVIGGCAIGQYALGGAALASKIACGGWANAHIAIGWSTSGDFTMYAGNNPLFEDFLQLVHHELPNTPEFILKLFYEIW